MRPSIIYHIILVIFKKDYYTPRPNYFISNKKYFKIYVGFKKKNHFFQGKKIKNNFDFFNLFPFLKEKKVLIRIYIKI